MVTSSFCRGIAVTVFKFTQITFHSHNLYFSHKIPRCMLNIYIYIPLHQRQSQTVAPIILLEMPPNNSFPHCHKGPTVE